MSASRRVCVILVAGLDAALLARAGAAKVSLGALAGKATAVVPPFPAVTCTVQATLTTGVLPAQHGIISNGLFTHGQGALQGKLDLSNLAEFRKDVSFWEQSNDLLDAPRFWQGMGKKTALLFFQNSIPGKTAAADIVITPKPVHTADGKTLTACWSNPAGLYERMVGKFGAFPLHNYWSPMAGLPASQWIVNAALEVWREEKPDLQMVYVPHMDYCLQRLGPGNAACLIELAALDAVLLPLVEAVRASGGVVVIVGDYAMSDVTTGILPNVALRQAELLTTRRDGASKVMIDYAKTAAFAMVDHQVAHVYAKKERVEEVAAALYTLPAIERIVHEPAEIAALGLGHGRSGNVIAIAQRQGWFAHDWWLSEAEKPVWQFSVDIHRKPGYDPRELFFDPVRKCVAQNIGLIKGSHGRGSTEAGAGPVLLTEAGVSVPGGGGAVAMGALAGWLKGLL
jgi:predicted AlkP superfamily pyrophosphatase or phosphodiesterase